MIKELSEDPKAIKELLDSLKNGNTPTVMVTSDVNPRGFLKEGMLLVILGIEKEKLSEEAKEFFGGELWKVTADVDVYAEHNAAIEPAFIKNKGDSPSIHTFFELVDGDKFFIRLAD